MTWFEAAVLGVIQGTTEFLPISSSAHLILTSRLLGWQDQGLQFDMAANSGSLLALIAYFRHDLGRMARACLKIGRLGSLPPEPEARFAGMLAVATLPIAVAGLLAQDWIAVYARSGLLIAVTSILFGLLLGVADQLSSRSEGSEIFEVGWRLALGVGAAQVLALIPGTSRSGVTMTAALFFGLSRPTAARFSLLLAVPVGILVALKDLLDVMFYRPSGVEAVPLVIGFLVSAIAAFVVIGWLLRWIERHSFTPFVVYRVFLGLVLLGMIFQ